MIGENKYKYIDSNAPKAKINYSYSKYLGLDFIEFWKSSREKNLKNLDKENLRTLINQNISFDDSKDFVLSKNLFLNWLDNIELEHKRVLIDVNLLVKRFEVTKKIYNDYNVLMRPSNKENYLNIENYSLFGIILGLLFSKTKDFKYLNAHLKINDILLGWKASNGIIKDDLFLKSYSVSLEYNNVIELLKQKNISHG